ncbi:MAG: amidase family protein, partial [Planctomycetota bacterium]|nr:amidase family protein [Planctomycetota bacterium]
LGVMRFHCEGYGDAVDAAFAQSCATLRSAGAELVEITDAPDLARISQLEWELLLEEFKDDINSYLSHCPKAVSSRTLADLIAFNESHRDEEMPYFGQEIFELSQATQGRASPDYAARAAEAARLAGPEGIDRLLSEHQCVALIAPTTGRAYPIRLEGGDQYEGACTTLPAVSGYPHLTVPMGLADGLPVGLSIIGTANSEALLLSLGAAFEVARDDTTRAAPLTQVDLRTFRDGDRTWDYAATTIDGWQVFIESSLASDTTLRHDIESTLADRLARVATQVPPEALAYIRTIPIWASDEPTYPMREGERGVIPFHPSPEWLREHGLNPAMAPGVHIINPRAVLYDHKVFEWGPETMLHELSHAYHFGRLGEDSTEVRAAFDHAMAQGLYQSIPSRRDPSVMAPAYAATNEKEYFAELTEAYFGHNDYFPHDRAELREYDPIGCAMVADAWGCTTDENSSTPLVWTTGSWTWTTVPEWGLDAAHPIGATHGGVIVDHHDHPHFNTDVDHGTLVFDASGARLGAIAGEYSGIHGMQRRVEDGVEYLYAAHLRGKQIVKLRMDGTAVWTLGVPAESHKYDDDAAAFNPTAVAVAPDGRLFVADGYGRNWIHAYSADRAYLKSFGGHGAEPGQFQTCHGLGIDERGRAKADGSGTREPLLVVCDRENRRLQRFTLAGEFVDVPVTGLRRPCSIAFWDGPHGERLIAVAELEGRATILDGDYTVLGHVGTNDDPKEMATNGVPPSDWKPGITTAPHGIGFDASGNLYIEDWNATGRVHKFMRGAVSLDHD